MADKYSTIQQHQPLRIPASFDKQGRMLIVQLDELFDDIYRRFGRLRVEDLGDKLKDLCLIKDEDGKYTSISGVAGELKIEIGDVEGNVSDLSMTVDGIQLQVSDIEGNVSDISLDVHDIQLQVSDIEGNVSNISLAVDGIDLQVEGIEGVMTAIGMTQNGIDMQGKTIRIRAGSEFKVESTGKFTVASDNLDVDETGLSVKGGTIKGKHYDEDGNPLLTGADIVVSSEPPAAADGRIWIKPQDTVTAEYRTSVSANANFWNGSRRSISYTLSGTAVTGQTGNNSYSLEIPVYCGSTSSGAMPITISVSNGTNSVSFSGTIPKAYYETPTSIRNKWTLSLNATDADWLATAASLTLTVTANGNPSQWDCETHGVSIGEIVLKMSSTGSSGSGWKSCEIKVYQG